MYLERLQRYAQQHQVAIHAFVLMTNHVHLLATPQAEKSKPFNFGSHYLPI
nr:transposase [Alishewanella longhuensis]